MRTLESTKARILFLFLLAITISILFFEVIENFLIALVMAAVLAGLSYPLYVRLLSKSGGRESLASALVVFICLLLVILPISLFLGVLVNEAVEISDTARDWVQGQVRQPEVLKEQMMDIPVLKKLVPYQDQILEKVGQLAGKAGGFVANAMAAGAKGTAEYFLQVFIMLYAMFYFLMDGRLMLNKMMRFMPLTEGDKDRLFSTFLSVSRATLKGSFVIGIVQGGLAGLSFAFVGIQGAVFWGAVMAILSLIPVVGAALVWIPAVIYLSATGQTVEAVGVGLWCALVVGTADNVLRPLLVGKETKMPDILVLLTTLGGLLAFGATGIVLGPVVGGLFLASWSLWSLAVESENEAVSESTDSER